MIIGIAGLGLIGGSLAKSYKRHEGYTIYGFDADSSTVGIAKLYGAIDGELDEKTVSLCDCIFVCLYPEAAMEYIRKIAPAVRKNAVVIDCCGTKRQVCEVGFETAKEHGFLFVGGHPMAGTHNSGFVSSTAELFDGACMIIVPPAFDDIYMLDRIKHILTPAGFAHVSVTTAESHDEVIAFTSQMAHVVSNGYIKSPTAREHKGFSAGSYKDLTRVAWLNPVMWAQLFIENKDNLTKELDMFINAMTQYRQAIADEDFDRLRDLLEEGRRLKEEVDGNDHGNR
ncbi:MAG: prephenate dehydrogenase/arogenate dehydrogenase family protein [Oscillospiraceae bacterium]|nr:prephenate dehydrogenase/arogenate dehydrogenase family protein [Oscillospiraceae bacterium]